MAAFLPRGRRRLSALAVLLGLVLLWRAETEWRQLQAHYVNLRQGELEAELDAARDAAAEDLRFLASEVEVARDALAERSLEVEEARERRRNLEMRLREAERRLRAARSDDDAEAIRAERTTVEGLREQVQLAGEAVDEIRADVLGAEAELAAARRPIDELEARLDAVDGLPLLRSLPGLRGWAPGIHWREVRVGSEARVDRCVTCHLGALGDAPVVDTDADTTVPTVFAAHPRPDLYLAADSPHPYDEVGCTACHGGDGRAVDFAAAGHGTSIRVGMAVEGACVACHDAPWLEQAPFQEAGRRWAAYLRCAACHETGRPDLDLPAPSLADLPRRTHPGWAARWIAAPSDFRPTAWMPHFFDAMPDAERDAEVNALVTWLWHRADEGQDTEPQDIANLQGDAERGEALWSQLACIACHPADGDHQRELYFDSPRRLRGPLLVDLEARYRGREEALVAYLETGHRPGLQLSEADARDLATSLLGTENELNLSLPRVDPEVRDRLLLRRLAAIHTLERAEARLADLGPVERDLRLGELAVERYACGACHELPGAATKPPRTGTSLRDLGERWRTESRHPETSIHDPDDPSLPRWHLSTSERAILGLQLAGWRSPPLGSEHAPTPTPQGENIIARHGCRACHALGGNVGVHDVPTLDGVGARLRSEWIFDLLADPERHRMRPWIGPQMPDFELSPAERSALAEYFAIKAGVPVLSPEPPAPTPENRALGAAVYDILQCNRCHEGAEVSDDGPALPIPAMAPDYRRSAERLRRDWLVDFLLDPPDDVPMPAIFPRRADGETKSGRDATYLLGSLETPMFDVQRRRLERFFAGREDMEAAFEDPQRVAEALADYMLSEDFATSGD